MWTLGCGEGKLVILQILKVVPLVEVKVEV
jgi:hypothetical protein